MKQLVFVLFFAFLSVANAQHTMTKEVSFDELIDSYSKHIYKDVSKAFEYALQAKSLAVVNGDAMQLAKVDYYIANCELELGKSKAALMHVEAAITQAEPLKNVTFLYNCLVLKGNILSELGEDSKALRTYIKASEYAKEIKDPIYEIAPLCSIAFIKKTHKDYEEAILIYKDVLKRLKPLNDTSNTKYYTLHVLTHIADIYLRLQNTEEATLYNDIGLQKSTDEQYASTHYPLLMNKAIIRYQKGEYKLSIPITKQVEEYAKDKNENLYLTSLFYLGKNAYQLHLYEESIQHLEKTYAIMKASDDVDTNEKELHEFLTLAYHKTNNSEKASHHFQQYRVLEKKESAADLKVNNETHALIDVVPLKTEIDTLGEQLTQETRNKKGFLYASIGLLILFVASILYYKARGKRIRKKFDALLEKVSERENDQKQKVSIQKETVSDEKVHSILTKLAKFEKDEAYLSKECSLGFMAEELGTNTAYLSKVINTYKGKSFTAYITELRIDTALVNLKNNKTLQSYTIMAIADEFGFKRQETFSRAFKAYTGIYPSQYLKNLKEKG